MNKLRLIFLGVTDFSSEYTINILTEYFILEYFSPIETYNPQTCIFVVSYPSQFKSLNKTENDLVDYLDQGFRIIFANIWEARPYLKIDKFIPYLNNILLILGCKNPYETGWKHVIATERWFWYNECLWYNTKDMNYHKDHYVPDRINNKLFFMPMKRQKPYRTRVREKLSEFLDQALWSYVEAWENPRSLPSPTESFVKTVAPDRMFEPSWYDETFFSVVVETEVDRQDQSDLKDEIAGLRPPAVACDIFVTEKTFKPIAFQHPFLVCGMQGTLKFLQENGFETYDHLFDETYDQLDLFEDRLDIIYNNIKNFDQSKYYDPLTAAKIKHNHNHFYDQQLVIQGITQDLIEPMLEWCNGR
jgi:hypothetical protein